MEHMRDFGRCVEQCGKSIVKDEILCLQMNLGYACNLSCNHCHVESSPRRTEMMSREVIDDCVSFAERAAVKVVDMTGGAPELNPHLRYLVERLRRIETVHTIILRSNLTLLKEAAYAELPHFLAENRVDIVGSLPCYMEENVTAQRGDGVYTSEIETLKMLNSIGYGTEELRLDLVYNPGGGFLPGPQAALETAYKEYLSEHFGITFNGLYTITNVPIGRFREDMEKRGKLEKYLDLLEKSFNAENVEKLMCRHMVNVDWQGRIYDCDFNQVLQLTTGKSIGEVTVEELSGCNVKVDEHCFACTAGTGSSCQGSLSS